MMALVNRGHHVTIFNAFQLKELVQNLTEINLTKEFPPLRDTLHFDFATNNYGSYSVSTRTEAFTRLGGAEMCRKTFDHPQIKDIIHGKHKFDILFTEIFATDCFLALKYKLRIPTISIATTHNLPWTADYTGNVDNPAFLESMYMEPSPDGKSTFWRRLENTKVYIAAKLAYYWYIAAKLAYYWYIDRPSETVVREVFGDDIPSLSELRRNVSLVMSNCHEILVGSRPTVPRFLPIAGIHLQEPDFIKVSKEIKTWLDKAPDGVLYFTLGSVVRSDSLLHRLLKALTDGFARLKPLRVLWKYESGKEHADAAVMPNNVMVQKWLPQVEILAHPNVKGFMTHGGLMSCIEALYNGVPMVGLPIFGDQAANVATMERLEIAVAVDHATLDAETVYNAIKKVVSDPTIRKNAKQLSARFRDRPIKPADAVVWWTEYIERHGGALFLESPSAYMPIYQYLLLDVVGAIFLAVLVLLAVIVYVIKLTIRMIRPRFQRTTARDKKKN